MPPPGFVSLQVREETARMIRFGAVVSGMTVVDYCDQIIRVWVSQSIQRVLHNPPENLRRTIEEASTPGQVIPLKK